MSMGVCAAIECGNMMAPCEDGKECVGYFCEEKKKACTSNAHCKQPAEKCYNYECVLADYCKENADCPSEFCDVEKSTCIQMAVGDVVEGGNGEEDTGGSTTCDPNDFEEPVSYLCAPCDDDKDCGCGVGVCGDLDGTKFCTTPCDFENPCISGYNCQDSVCKPLGGECKGCILPPGCEEAGTTCNFKIGECMAKVPLCAFCVFDYECGLGNRCHKDDDDNIYCAPECEPITFSCPLASGCKIRDDGLYVCEPLGGECCYGLSCDTCACEQPTPFCDEKGGCVQCLANGDCPPGKPICDPETHSCIIQCLPPTPVFWTDPETGLEYCVECTKSKHCPPSYLCGTFVGEPNTYHKCYPAPE